MNKFDLIGVVLILLVSGLCVAIIGIANRSSTPYSYEELLEQSKARDAEIYRLEVCAEIRHNYLVLDLECPAIQPPER